MPRSDCDSTLCAEYKCSILPHTSSSLSLVQHTAHKPFRSSRNEASPLTLSLAPARTRTLTPPRKATSNSFSHLTPRTLPPSSNNGSQLVPRLRTAHPTCLGGKSLTFMLTTVPTRRHETIGPLTLIPDLSSLSSYSQVSTALIAARRLMPWHHIQHSVTLTPPTCNHFLVKRTQPARQRLRLL